MSFKIISCFLSFLLIISVLAEDNNGCEVNSSEGLYDDKCNEDIKYDPPEAFPVEDESLINEDENVADNIENNENENNGLRYKHRSISCEEPAFENPLQSLDCCEEGHITPTNICASCDINLASTGDGVIISCHNCTSLTGQPVNLDTSYFVNFVQMTGFGRRHE